MASILSDANWQRVNDREIRVSGAWNLLLDTRRRRRLLRELGQLPSPRTYRWNLEQLEALDSAGALVLWKVWNCELPEDLACEDNYRLWFRRLAETHFPDPPARHRLDEVLRDAGEVVMGVIGTIGGILLLIGQLMVDVAYCVTHPRVIPWKETAATIYYMGARSVLLIGLVGFLIGVVMTIQIGIALQNFGSPLLIIYMLGLAALRELGPIICGLILAGRSGSAMTAGIGAMHLTGEYDALRAFGSSPSLRLALPRVVGAAISLPLLVVWADFVAVLGGAITAQSKLGVRYALFLSQLPQQIQIVNFWIGLGKGALFGITIALVGCYFGMHASPDTEGLSRNTTLSVVTSLVLILLFDAGADLLLTNVGLT